MTNPHPQRYRLAQVCLVCGSEAGFAALLPRRGAARKRLRARLQDEVAVYVQPLMTQAMLEELVRVIAAGCGLRARWEGNVAILSDSAAGGAERRVSSGRHGLYDVGEFTTVGGHDWTWVEVAPPWPGGVVDAGTILSLLRTRAANTWPIANQIKANAGIHALSQALRVAGDDAVRERLCHLLGHRERGDAAIAAPALLDVLDDAHAGLRGEAADALGRIALREGREAVLASAPRAGELVLGALIRERDERASALLAAAAGALRYQPAVPRLIELLADGAWLVRLEAAAALAALSAPEAGLSLQRALALENDPAVALAMRSALAAIKGPARQRSGWLRGDAGSVWGRARATRARAYALRRRASARACGWPSRPELRSAPPAAQTTLAGH